MADERHDPERRFHGILHLRQYSKNREAACFAQYEDLGFMQGGGGARPSLHAFRAAQRRGDSSACNRVKANRFSGSSRSVRRMRRQTGQRAAQFAQNLVNGATQRAIECAAGCVFVAAASQPGGNRLTRSRSPFTAQAHPDASIRQFAQEKRGLNSRDTQRDIHNAFTIFLRGAGPHHVLFVIQSQARRPSRVRRLQRCSQQQKLRRGNGKVHLLGDGDGVGSGRAPGPAPVQRWTREPIRSRKPPVSVRTVV